jgi:hypothetical protein
MKFEELHKHELAERDRLRSAATPVIGLLVLLGGALGAMLQNAWFEARPLSIAFGLAAVAAGITFLVACWLVARCCHGHTYKILPSPGECRTFHLMLRDWHKNYGAGEAAADKEFDDWVEERCCEAADVNTQLNLNRSRLLYHAHTATIGCAVLILLTAVPYTVHRHALQHALQPAQRVEIVGVPADELKRAFMASQEQKPQPPQQPPPKPVGPPLRDLREGALPKPPPIPKSPPKR